MDKRQVVLKVAVLVFCLVNLRADQKVVWTADKLDLQKEDQRVGPMVVWLDAPLVHLTVGRSAVLKVTKTVELMVQATVALMVDLKVETRDLYLAE